MLRHVALVRTDVLEELSASIIRVTRSELGTTLAVTSNRHSVTSQKMTFFIVTAVKNLKSDILLLVFFPFHTIVHTPLLLEPDAVGLIILIRIGEYISEAPDYSVFLTSVLFHPVTNSVG
jgi:hypothetical protein